MIKFTAENLNWLWKPGKNSGKGENGQVVIIGGSSLFHGAPILALRTASRMVDMVYFSSPEKGLEQITAKAGLQAFIWVPWEEIEHYVEKSDAVLIGPGFMRYAQENSKYKVLNPKEFDREGTLTRSVTKYFLQKYPHKKWVIDGGSLQVMEKEWIPKKAVLTCNKKEFELLFNVQYSISDIQDMAKKYGCVVVHKGVVTCVSDGEVAYEVAGGNAGLTKGGTGDIQAGLAVGFLAKNESLLAASAAAFLIKAAADEIYNKVGFNYNADDIADQVFATYKSRES